MSKLVSLALLLVVLTACGGGVAEPTSAYDAEVQAMMDAWGGEKQQYRAIFAVTDCARLDEMMQSAAKAIDTEGFGTDAQKVRIGYANAIMTHRARLGC